MMRRSNVTRHRNQLPKRSSPSRPRQWIHSAGPSFRGNKEHHAQPPTIPPPLPPPPPPSHPHPHPHLHPHPPAMDFFSRPPLPFDVLDRIVGFVEDHHHPDSALDPRDLRTLRALRLT